MFSSGLSLSVYALSVLTAVNALPSALHSEYAVKERHIVPRGWTDAGPASKSEVINLQIGLKQRNEGVVEQHLIEVSDPMHPRYGQHLTAAEIHDIVAPAEESVALVHSWLMEHGINEIGHNPSKDWVSVIVPLEKAEELLNTKYSKYVHEDGTTISRTPEWSLPAHLHEHIDVVQPTNSFFRIKANSRDLVKPLPGDHSWPVSWWEKTGKHEYGPPGGYGVSGLARHSKMSELITSFSTLR